MPIPWVQLAVVAGNYALSYARNRARDRATAKPQARPISQSLEIPGWWALGRCRVAPELFFYQEAGDVLDLGLLLAEGPCDGVDAVWIDDRRLLVTGVYAHNLALENLNTLQTRSSDLQVWAYLAADGAEGPAAAGAGGSLEDVAGWSAAHKVKGRSWLHVRLSQAGGFFDRVPQIEVELRGLKTTWPGQSAAAWTESPVALQYWRLRALGVPASRIASPSSALSTAAADLAAADHSETLTSGASFSAAAGLSAYGVTGRLGVTFEASRQVTLLSGSVGRMTAAARQITDGGKIERMDVRLPTGTDEDLGYPRLLVWLSGLTEAAAETWWVDDERQISLRRTADAAKAAGSWFRFAAEGVETSGSQVIVTLRADRPTRREAALDPPDTLTKWGELLPVGSTAATTAFAGLLLPHLHTRALTLVVGPQGAPAPARYVAGGVVRADELQQLGAELDLAAGAPTVEAAGQWHIHAGAPATSTTTIPKGDVLGVRFGILSLSDRPTTVRVEAAQSDRHSFRPGSVTATDATRETAEGSTERVLRCGLISSHVHLEQLAIQQLRQAGAGREARVHLAPGTVAAGSELDHHDLVLWASVTVPDPAGRHDDLTGRIIGRTVRADMSLDLHVVEDPAALYDAVSVPAPAYQRVAVAGRGRQPAPIEGLAATAVTVQAADGTDFTHLAVDWTSAGHLTHLQWKRTAAGSSWRDGGLHRFQSAEVELGGDAGAEVYVRARHRVVDRLGEWSESVTVTTADTTAPATPAGATVASANRRDYGVDWSAPAEKDYAETAVFVSGKVGTGRYGAEAEVGRIKGTRFVGRLAMATGSGVTEDTARSIKVRLQHVDYAGNTSAKSTAVEHAMAANPASGFAPEFTFQKISSGGAAPATPTADAYPPSGWSEDPPSWDADAGDVVYVSMRTASGANQWSTPRRWSGPPGDTGFSTQFAYKAAQSQPATPTADANPPSGWSASPPSIGSTGVWVTVRTAGGANQWSTPALWGSGGRGASPGRARSRSTGRWG